MQIVEVGPRDGLQNETRTLSTQTKLEYIERLVGAGVSRIEAVSFARPDKVPQMADAEALMAQVPRREDVRYIGLVMNERGAQRAVETQVDEANIVVVATDTFAQKNQGMTTEQSIHAAESVIQRLKAAGISVSVTVAASFGCPFEGEVSTEHVLGIAERLATLDIDEIAVADTIGVAVPAQVRSLIKGLRGTVPQPLRIHLHNTRNTGYANALAALELGVEALDSSAGGIGGCPFAPAATGNIATEDLLYLASRSGYSSQVDPTQIMAAADFITSALGIETPALLGRAGWFP